MATAQTPRARGLRMPAEWEPHRATWLSWPHNPETWPGAMREIEGVWARLVAALSPGEEVHVLIGERASAAALRERLAAAGAEMQRVFLHAVRTNDAWIRDCGPTFLRGEGGAQALVDWTYNAWGGKYPPWDDDDRIPGQIARIVDLPVYRSGIVLEGGSIEVDGAGTLITTESCLLNPNRNPHLKRPEIERVLADYLGVDQFIWLGDGVAGDDTDGHVDDLTRFVAPAAVVTAVEDDAADVNYRPLRDNLERLEKAVDRAGRALQISTLPMPPPIHWRNQRLPASYANFYIGNRAVVVPTFGSPRDDTALAILEGLFPGRRIVGIDAVALVAGLGAFHCVTQQQPA